MKNKDIKIVVYICLMSKIINYLKSCYCHEQGEDLPAIDTEPNRTDNYLYDVHYANGVKINKIYFAKLYHIIQFYHNVIIRIDRLYSNDKVIMIYAKYINPWNADDYLHHVDDK